MEITILGCGPSYGIPTAKFGFGNCNPNNPKNFRTRSSIFVSDGKTNLLIDTPPELRLQLYNSNIQNIDAVMWTHMHADHLMGIDDVRVYTRSQITKFDEVIPLPAYLNGKDFEEFKNRFAFYLQPFSYLNQKKPPFDMHLIKAGQAFKIGSLDIFPILQDHGSCETLGFKINNSVAYNTDLVDFINFDIMQLKGIDLWILDCVSPNANDKHLYLEKVLKWFEIVQPKRLVLTHLGAKMDYDTIMAQLPKGMELAYDGMRISV